MERGSRILLFILLFTGLYFFMGGFGDKKEDIQPITTPELRVESGEPKPEQTCQLETAEFRATIGTRGGAIKAFQTKGTKYRHDGEQIELATTPDHAHLSPLFTTLRNPASGARPDDLLDLDLFHYELASSSDKECVLVYESEKVRIEKRVAISSAPYSLNTELRIENRSGKDAGYSLILSTGAYLKDSLVESKMFRMNPLATHVECIDQAGEVVRERREDFEPGDFEEKERFVRSATNDGNWSEMRGVGQVAAVSNAYFTTAVSHESGPVTPVCQMQIEDRWDSAHHASRQKDPEAAAIYKARLSYPSHVIPAGGTDVYQFKAYIGPKERKALALAGDRFDPIIDLGFFSSIAKILVTYLLYLHSVVPSWGLAIVILTITARVLLFPLSVPSIRNMIHMRELKPEMDKLTEKFKDDPQARGLAQMELWKKHGVNPMKGCLPQMASMPVWFALYTTLQTAVELYNIPFLWFPDLSAPDPYYLLPFIIGGVYFVQQKIMPMQAGDPAQQKMMLYMMPGMFTLFMLFLPAGLGVYMFTNSLLGILQQRAVEYHAQKTLSSRVAVVTTSSEGTKAG